jgi:hypothetical protein
MGCMCPFTNKDHVAATCKSHHHSNPQCILPANWATQSSFLLIVDLAEIFHVTEFVHPVSQLI